MARKSSSEQADEIRQRLARPLPVAPPSYTHALSTSSTLLNLACTGQPRAGFVRGGQYLFVGDSNSGKSWISLASMAEAAQNSHYDSYRFIYDASERGAQMNMEKYFGKRMVSRLEPPCTLKDEPWHSATIEEFYFNLEDALDKGPCIYVLDSMDGLSSESEDKSFTEAKKAHAKGNEMKGSFGDGKAKKNSQYLRRTVPKLEKTGSILIIISQTRDDIGGGPFATQTRAGGRSLTYYAQIEMWSKVVKQLKSSPVRDKERHVGNNCEIHVKRSRYTGRQVKVRVPIYFSAGVDDVGSCIDYLIEEKHWTKAGGGIVNACEFDQKLTRERLIHYIEDNEREDDLQDLVHKVWMEIEEECAVIRKPRYE